MLAYVNKDAFQRNTNAYQWYSSKDLVLLEQKGFIHKILVIYRFFSNRQWLFFCW